MTAPARRIVSLVPSQTEVLYHLGLTDEVAGITKFCVHPPEWFRTKKRIGGTKTLHLEEIARLEPDLILANKEENTKEQVEYLAARFPVWTSDITLPEEAFSMMEALGGLTGKEEEARSLVQKIRSGFGGLAPEEAGPPVAYLIWREPYMTAGGDTFIHHMLAAAGFRNVFAQRSRYPAITLAELLQSGCTHIFLSSEPYPFSERHRAELGSCFPVQNIHLVDGEVFSWYGSRMLQAPAYFEQLRRQVGPVRTV